MLRSNPTFQPIVCIPTRFLHFPTGRQQIQHPSGPVVDGQGKYQGEPGEQEGERLKGGGECSEAP
jgi:hypothetical protein